MAHLQESEEFGKIMQWTAKKILSLLIIKEAHFYIKARVAGVKFIGQSPGGLDGFEENFFPNEIMDFELDAIMSVKIDNESLVFMVKDVMPEIELDDICTVKVGIKSIRQITVDDNVCLFQNMAIEPKAPPQQKRSAQQIISNRRGREGMAERSQEALLNNPENENLFKK